MKHKRSTQEDDILLRKFAYFLEEQGVLFPTTEKTVEAFIANHKEEIESTENLPEPMELIRLARARREAKKKQQ